VSLRCNGVRQFGRKAHRENLKKWGGSASSLVLAKDIAMDIAKMWCL